MVTKGAPEKVIRFCKYELDDCHNHVDFDGSGMQGDRYLENTVDEIA